MVFLPIKVLSPVPDRFCLVFVVESLIASEHVLARSPTTRHLAQPGDDIERVTSVVPSLATGNTVSQLYNVTNVSMFSMKLTN